MHPGNPGPATLYHDTKNDLAGAAPPARPDYCCTREESKIGHQPPIRLIPAPHIAGVHSSRRGKPDRYSLWHLRTFCSSAYRVLYRPPPMSTMILTDRTLSEESGLKVTHDSSV